MRAARFRCHRASSRAVRVRGLVVSKVDELPGAQVQCVGPVFVFSNRVEDNVLLIRTPPGSAKSALVSNTLKYLGDRVIGRISLTAALVDGIDDQVR